MTDATTREINPGGAGRAGPRPATRTLSFQSGGSDAWAVHYEANRRKANGSDVIVLTIGDPDFDTPRPIVEAAIASLERGETHYTPAAGIDTYLEAVSLAETQRLGRTISRTEITTTQGAQNGLYAAMQCLVDPGDEVIVSDPAYPTFSGVVGGAGGVMVRAPLAFDGENFRFELEVYERLVTPRTRVVLFNAPHNPTGAVVGAREARWMADFAARHDLWLICDEVYAEMCFEEEYVSPASFADTADRVLSMRSLSKSHAMAGWRCGWIVAPADLTRHIRNATNCMLFGGAEFIQQAAAVGLGLDVSREMRDAYRRRRDLVLETLAGLNRVRPLRPMSGVFMLVDVRGTGLSGDEYAWRLLDATGVAVTPADHFSPVTHGFVRVSLCTPDAELAEACRRMAAFSRTLDGAAAMTPAHGGQS
ncbi:MAG: aminotransferase class I/II-fold pyridoxal phosphate-dependent enzyme [Rhizobiales bacterium]|nr:aminotransferase class I/II-fold pyridoxal phosphate-dependent enzyme [Hyphomicrobiales bacterium]